MYNKDPKNIEKTSFEIIHQEALEQGIIIEEKLQPIVYRVIHTTADFEYGRLLECHPDFLEIALQVMKNNPKIYTDTEMIIAGVNRPNAKRLGLELCNYVHEAEIYEIAEKEGITRSMAATQKAVRDGDIDIFACGNAPTSIFQLRDLKEQGEKMPKLIIGVPVGFVGASESKEVAKELGIPYIVVNGRKGGSTIASAIINALMKLVD